MTASSWASSRLLTADVLSPEKLYASVGRPTSSLSRVCAWTVELSGCFFFTESAPFTFPTRSRIPPTPKQRCNPLRTPYETIHSSARGSRPTPAARQHFQMRHVLSFEPVMTVSPS